MIYILITKKINRQVSYQYDFVHVQIVIGITGKLSNSVEKVLDHLIETKQKYIEQKQRLDLAVYLNIRNKRNTKYRSASTHSS